MIKLPNFKVLLKSIPGVRAIVAIAVIVFILGIFISIVTWRYQKNLLRSNEYTTLTEDVTHLNSTVSYKLNTDSDLSEIYADLLNINLQINDNDWQKVSQNIDINNQYRGIKEIGYIQNVSRGDLSTFELLTGDGSSFSVYPTGDRSEYAPVKFIVQSSPSEKSNLMAYDMLSDPVLKEAIENSRDNGKPTLSKEVILPHISDNNQPNLVMFTPLYRSTPTNIVERRQQIIGYVYIVISVKDFFNQPLINEGDLAYQVYQGDNTPANLIYQSDNFASSLKGNALSGIRHTQQTVAGLTLTFVSTRSDNILSLKSLADKPKYILIGGIAFSFVMAAIILILMLTRSRYTAYLEQLKTQESKDELLSLASHQLRTPATAVKQYIGMLTEGYLGELTEVQINALQKAYISNERQLETINQILYVAKADAGQLNLHKRKFDMNLVVGDVITDALELFHERRQKLSFRPKNKQLFVKADENSIRMVFENLLTNAGKYTKNGGKVIVRTYKEGTRAVLSVEDSGVGIEQEKLDQLFKKFSRIDNELSIQAGGSGMGLYLDKILVDLHGGSIDVETIANKGSIFIVKIPININNRKKKA